MKQTGHEKSRLKSILLKGYKSVDKKGQEIELGPVTVLIGANGAGKSNLVSFLRLVNFLTTGGLQKYVADQGFAESLLYFGSKTTTEISAELRFESGNARDEYRFALGRDATDRLFLQDETIVFHSDNSPTPQVRKLGGGVRESLLQETADKGDKTCRVILSLLRNCRVFQFHDTSPTAKIRTGGYVDDAQYLRSDAGNLAAFLKAMQHGASKQKYYDRIVEHIRMMVPQFGDFDLNLSPENDKYIRLNWREKDSDYLFGPHQLSDGSLRFMALTALFLQPPDLLPGVIVVDEPELGLHPAAISELAGMAKTAARHCQVILATQSSSLVDEFTADQVVVVERDTKLPRSIFRGLDSAALKDWLKRYSLSELWDKNVLGGRP